MKSEEKRKGKREYIGAVKAISGNKGIAMSVIVVTLCLFSVLSVSAVQVSENVKFQTPGTSTTFVMGSDFTFDTIEVHSTKLMLDNAAISVHPSVGSITFTLFNFSTDYKKWSEKCSNPDAITTHTLGGFKTNTPYRVIVNGETYWSDTSNNSGYVSFTYSGGDSDVVFEMEEAGPTLSPTPSATPTPTQTPEPTPGTPQLTISHTTLVPAEVGEETIIKVSIMNTGTGDAKNIKLRERIPSGLSIDYVDGADSTGNLVSWDGDLMPGQTYSIKHSLKVLTEGDKIIEATVAYEDIAGKEYTTSTTNVLTPPPTPTVTPTSPDSDTKKILAMLSGIIVAIIIYLWLRGKGREEEDRGRVEVTIEEE